MNIENFLQTRTQWFIRTFVLAMHTLLLFSICYYSYTSTTKKAVQRLAVHTVTLTPVQPTITPTIYEAPISLPVNPPTPVTLPVEAPVKPISTTKPTPTVKKPTPSKPKPKEQKKTITTSKKIPSPAAQEKKQQEKKQQEQKQKEKQQQTQQSAMITDALSSLDQSKLLQSKRTLAAAKGETATIAIPSAITSLSSESLISITDDSRLLSPQEKTYQQELSQRLKLLLKLPEYGEVEIKLTLSRLGKATCVKCVQFKSAKNARYLEKKLRDITFPPFGEQFPNEQEHTFHLHLSNELNY